MNPYWIWSLAALMVWIAGAAIAAAAPAFFTKSRRETSWFSAITPPSLHEVIFDLLEYAFFRRLVLDGKRLAQLFEKLALRPAQFGGDLHVDVNEKIAAAVSVY